MTAASILVEAAMYDNLHGQAFPFFGAERRGAPVTAFARISDKPILRHGMFYDADILVVLDPSLITSGVVKRVTIRRNGIVVANVRDPSIIKKESFTHQGNFKGYWVNATEIAEKLNLIVAGWPVVNTAMLGALVKASGIVSVDSVKRAVKHYFPGKPGEVNAEAVARAYEETREVEVM